MHIFQRNKSLYTRFNSLSVFERGVLSSWEGFQTSTDPNLSQPLNLGQIADVLSIRVKE